MSNPYYNTSGTPVTSSFGASANVRAEFASVMAAFDMLPVLSGNANKIVTVNSGASALSISPISINGILQMLDPNYVSDYTGIPVGAKRLNPATGIEQWNGSAWSLVTLGGYLTAAGGTLTGALIFTNNVALDWKDSGGATRRIAVVNGSNGIYLGDVDSALSTSQTYLRGHSGVNFDINSTTVATINSSGQFNVGAQSVSGTSWSAAFAQPVVFGNGAALNGIVGNATPSSTFTVDTDKVLPTSGLSWKSFSDEASGPSAALAGFGNVRFYTNAVERARFSHSGGFLIGATTDDGSNSRFQVNGAVSAQVLYAYSSEAMRVKNDAGTITFYDTANSTETGFVRGNTGSDITVGAIGSNDVLLATGGLARLTVDGTTGKLFEGTSANELGYKGAPVSAGWVNGQVWMTAANQTVPNNITAGTVYGVYNNSASTITLTPASGLTLRLAGQTSTGARTVAAFGIATIWYPSSTTGVCNGNVS